jgi:hypothetical protein
VVKLVKILLIILILIISIGVFMGLHGDIKTLDNETIKLIGSGYDLDGTVLFESLVVPVNRQVMFIVAPSTTDRVGPSGPINAWNVFNDGTVYSDTFNEGWLVLGTVLATDYESHKASGSPGDGRPTYANLKITWTAGTYENIKLYARQAWYREATDDHWDSLYTAPWLAIEMAAD